MSQQHECSPLLGNAVSGANASYTPTSQSSSTFTSPQHPEAKTAEQRHQETRGLIYMTLSALFFSFMSLLVSLTAKTLPSFEIVLFRGIIQTSLGVLACWYLGISPLGKPGVRFLLFCRGLAGSCGLACFFYALSALPLADATVIFFLGPTFTAILGRIVLKEPFTPLDALASTVSMVGVVLVAKPSVLFCPPPPSSPPSALGESMFMLGVMEKDSAERRLSGALAALGGAMCSAVVSCLLLFFCLVLLICNIGSIVIAKFLCAMTTKKKLKPRLLFTRRRDGVLCLLPFFERTNATHRLSCQVS